MAKASIKLDHDRIEGEKFGSWYVTLTIKDNVEVALAELDRFEYLLAAELGVEYNECCAGCIDVLGEDEDGDWTQVGDNVGDAWGTCASDRTELKRAYKAAKKAFQAGQFTKQ